MAINVNDCDPFEDGSGIALYQFEDNLEDTCSTYPLIGENINFSGGKFGTALNIGVGTKAYSDEEVVLTDFSISFWYNGNIVDVNERLITIRNSSGMIITIVLSSSWNNIGISVTGTDTKYIATPAQDIENKMKHICFSVTNNVPICYVDGIAVSLDGPLPFIDAAYHSIEINQNNAYLGVLDQVRIFNRALAEEEILELYNETERTDHIRLGNNPIDNVMLGSNQVNKIYLGSNILFGKESPINVNDCDPFGDGSGIALYKLEDNATDTCGNYNGTWNGTEQYGSGKFLKAALFDGSSRIELPNELTLPDTSNYSFSFWYNTSQGSGLIAPFSHMAQKYSLFLVRNGLLEFNIGGGNLIKDTNNTADGIWHFACGTVSSSGVAFYVDDIEVGSNSQIPSDTSGYNNIGVYNGNGSVYEYYFIGLVDQVRIFNRTLTAGEVQELYNETEITNNISLRSN